MKLTFAEATWYFLAACEEIHFFSIIGELNGTHSSSESEMRSLVDNVLVHTKWPMEWIRRSCTSGGIIPSAYDDKTYEAATLLSDISMNYLPFESAFSYASWGLLELAVDGNRIRTSGAMKTDSRYDAYDRLVGYETRIGIKAPEDNTIATMIRGSLNIRGESFKYSINPSLVKTVLEWIGPALDKKFRLPRTWRLPEYSLAEFGAVAKVLWALSFVHDQARLFAAVSGCKSGGYSNSLLLMGRDELAKRLHRYSRVSHSAIDAVLTDLTYGARGQVNPDPALQPLFHLNYSTFAISPSIMLSSSIERNLMVLTNRIPEAKAIYARLNHERETESRSRVINSLSEMDLRFCHGQIRDWGPAAEIDLAIVSDAEKTCLILELKAFIGPAEAREIKDRSEEISKGIKQIHARRSMYERKSEALKSFLQIDSRYQVFWAVGSETSIGANYVQDPQVAVVNLRHLVKHINHGSLNGSCLWLEHRRYLPVEGIHYREVPTESTVGRWTIEWYGIKELTDDYLGNSVG